MPLAVVRGDRLTSPAACGVSVFGGLLLAASFPPLAWRFLAPLGVACLLAAVYHQPRRLSFWCGLLHGLAFFVPLLSWLQTGAGTNAWLILAVLETLIVAGSAIALSYVTLLPLWPVWAAAVWVGQEAVRGRFPFGGFTWGRLGFSQDAGPLLRWASVGGPALVSFVVALVGGLLVVSVRRAVGVRRLFSGSRPVLVGTSLLAAVAVVVAGPLLPSGPQGDSTVVVAVVQGNVPRLGLASFDREQQDMVIRNHVEATFQLADEVESGRLPRPAFVVWPENSTDRDPRTDPEVGGLVESAAARIGVPVLVGAVLDKPHDEAENAGVVWDPSTGFGAKYVKRHLVPFGEYVPFRSVLTPVFGRLALVAHDFVPASDDAGAPLTIAGTRIGDVICFEVAYDGLVRDSVREGAEVLVVQTNNASFGRSALTRQQLAMSKVRAVEHGRAVLVTATSGISAVIRPDGSTLDESSIWTRDLLVHAVPLVSRTTFATRYGNWVEWLLVLVGAGAVSVSVGDTLRRR